MASVSDTTEEHAWTGYTTIQLQYESDKRIGSVSAKNMRLSSVFDYPEETIHNKFYTSKPRNLQIMHVANRIQ